VRCWGHGALGRLGSCDAADFGDDERLAITGLRPRTTYSYAIAALDDVSGWIGPRSAALTTRTR